MVIYHVTVFTGTRLIATTFNHVHIKLVGSEGETARTLLLNLKGPSAFIKGSVSTFTVSCPHSIGKLVLIELDKKPLPLFPQDSWFLDKVEVKSPEGNGYIFPIYRWITDCEVHSFREGTALRVFEDDHPLGKYSREVELQHRKEDYCWYRYKEGLPYFMKIDSPFTLPWELHFSFTKRIEMAFDVSTGVVELNLKGLAKSKKGWTDFSEIDRVFCSRESEISEYVQKHWKEDALFGYQYLNGINPIMIRRCKALPENFPVTDEMVCYINLADEMKKGNIFLCDYKNLDGIESTTLNRKKQYLMAPLVLLYKTPHDKLVPIAIQLKQKPGKDNLIFLPTDPEYDWLLAKTFVRSADLNEHESHVHLLRTHLMMEVFAVAMMRCLPMVHPLHKLLIPHTRYTMQINFLGRKTIMSEKGFFNKYSSCGVEGLEMILRKSLSCLTYSSLCLPEDIAERGMESIPNYYYRDDGLRIWEIIHRFVKGIIEYYYKNDDEVQHDTEIQNWILDIFKHGFLCRERSGIPQRFTTAAELTKFVTMVIFTATAKHAAVNAGQYDYGSWMPNAPSSMKLPPPTEKGKSSEDTLLETLPDVNITVNSMALLWVLSQKSSDFIPLAHYFEDHFTEETPRKLMKEFQRELQMLSAGIKARNKNLKIPYTYMDPEWIENSVAI